MKEKESQYTADYNSELKTTPSAGLTYAGLTWAQMMITLGLAFFAYLVASSVLEPKLPPLFLFFVVFSVTLAIFLGRNARSSETSAPTSSSGESHESR